MTITNRTYGLQSALEYVEERGGGAGSTPPSAAAAPASAGGSAAGSGAGAGSCTCGAGPCSCRRAAATHQPALVFVHAALYQEECLAIDTDVQLIGELIGVPAPATAYSRRWRTDYRWGKV